MDIKKNQSVTWIWVTATVIFCSLFALVFIPRAAAQGSLNLPSPEQTENTQAQERNYINIMQNVYRLILRNYVE